MLTRRTLLVTPLAAAALCAMGCGGSAGAARTHVFVMGTIHARHRASASYSLAVLERAMRAARPDILLMELPPANLAAAWASWRARGRVDEPRANVFPEYTEVAIPLADRLGWATRGVAAWSPEIAAQRRATLEAIRSDPARARHWAEHQAARREFARRLAGRSDDPRFIHTDAFDELVAASREPYARHFDADLGPGGWTQINAAHNALIDQALDRISGRGLRALITFGTAHKYKLRQSLARRSDIVLESARALFD